MAEAKVISFDVDGTLVTPDFTYAVWYEVIPRLYAHKRNMSFEEARRLIEAEYAQVGDQRLEWYDIKYWFNYFQLGDAELALESCRSKVCYYPEVKDVLASLVGYYKLIIISSSTREFLRHLLQDIKHYFIEVFSSISDYGQLKTPDFYSKVCQSMHIKPQQLLHVGDNWEFDYLIPRKLGIQAFHLDRNGQTKCSESLTTLSQLPLP